MVENTKVWRGHTEDEQDARDKLHVLHVLTLMSSMCVICTREASEVNNYEQSFALEKCVRSAIMSSHLP